MKSLMLKLNHGGGGGGATLHYVPYSDEDTCPTIVRSTL